MSTDATAARNLETVGRLNGMFTTVEFATLRDALEEADSLEAFADAGFSELARLVSESVAGDVKVNIEGAAGRVEGGEFAGLSSWLDLWRNWLSAWDTYEVSASGEEAIGDNVIVDVIHRGQGRGSGIEVELPQCQLWTLRDGKVTRCRIYETRDQALRAVEAEA
jgi:hypothetical protein